MLHEEALTAQIIGAAIEVHRRLGPAPGVSLSGLPGQGIIAAKYPIRT